MNFFAYFEKTANDLAPVLKNLLGKKVLITGGTGFFGKNFLDFFWYLHAKDLKFDVFVCSRNPKEFQYQYPHYKYCFLSPDTLSLRRDLNFDYIIHLATDYTDPNQTCSFTNVVLDTAQRNKIDKFLYASSGAIYGTNPPLYVSESYRSTNLTPYASNKLQTEQQLSKQELPAVICRYFSFIGPYFSPNFAFGQFARHALQDKHIIICSSGEAIRSYLSTFDLVSWSMRLLLDREIVGTFNVGSEKPISIKDLALTISEMTSSRVEILEGDSNGLAGETYVPSTAKIRDHVGVMENHSLTDILTITLDWAQSSENIIR